MSTEVTLDLEYITIAGKLWGPANGLPTIALHGYLDNANSFDMIAPHLDHLRIFAMDFAGHGHSEHRRQGDMYSGLNDIRDVLAVADKLGWKTFNLLGHSMGAEIGSQLAGLFPERVDKLICIDGYSGTNNASSTLDHFRSTVVSSLKTGSQLKVFPTLEAMTERLSLATGQNPTSARCIIDRGHATVEGGYTWRTDPRIKGSGPFELTNDQLHALLERTTAETLFIVADMENNWLKRSIELIASRNDAHMTLVSRPGHHHLHMQEHSGEVVQLIRSFMFKRLDKTA